MSGSINLIACKTCEHAKEDHKGIAMICMKQIGKNPHELCDCNWFDDGTIHVLPMRPNVFTLKAKEPIDQENK